MTGGAVISIGEKVEGIDGLGTAAGAFDLLAGGVLGAAANLELKQLSNDIANNATK